MYFKFFFLLSLLVVNFSCNIKCNFFENYLQSISRKIEKDSFNMFIKSSVYDEATLNLIYNDVEKSIKKLPKNSMESIFLDSISNELKTKSIFVSIALHQCFNNKSFDKNKVKEIFLNIEKIKYLKKIKCKNIEIHRKELNNNSKFLIGDTILGQFIIDTSFNQKRLVYNKWVSDFDYLSFKPNLKLTGIILDKFYRRSTNNNSKFKELIFKCKILEISDTNVYYNDNVLKPSFIININISSYGRLLVKR